MKAGTEQGIDQEIGRFRFTEWPHNDASLDGGRRSLAGRRVFTLGKPQRSDFGGNAAPPQISGRHIAVATGASTLNDKIWDDAMEVFAIVKPVPR